MLSELLSGSVPLEAYLLVAAVLFCTGVWGLINSRNAVRVLMSIELMLNAVNINLMAFSSYVDGQLIRGQVFSVFVITVAAAEAAVGLAILLFDKNHSKTSPKSDFGRSWPDFQLILVSSTTIFHWFFVLLPSTALTFSKRTRPTKNPLSRVREHAPQVYEICFETFFRASRGTEASRKILFLSFGAPK